MLRPQCGCEHRHNKYLDASLAARPHVNGAAILVRATLHISHIGTEENIPGSICFSGLKPNNYKVRSLFLKEIISTPYVIFYWNSFFNNVNWTQVWSLPQKFLLTNKVKEISYKLIHRVYPTKVFLQKF